MRLIIVYLVIVLGICTSCTKEEYCEYSYNNNGEIIGERCWYGEKQPKKIECHGYYRGIGCGGD